MYKTPEISAIMSVYNGEAYLAEAIESVRNQTFENWELIVINDCSTDSTGDILREFSEKDSRIKVHTNEENLRLPASLNKALDLAVGKFVARIDSDDIALPQRFEKQVEFMNSNPDVMISSCRFMIFKNGVVTSGGGGGRCDFDTIRAMLVIANPILHPGVIARADVMKKLRYDTTLTCTEDLEMWSRAAKSDIKIVIQDEYLMLYRIHDKQITSTTLDRQKKEVIGIENNYFTEFFDALDDEMKAFYIDGIYFNNILDTKKLRKFYGIFKDINKKTKFCSDEAVDYAFFGILAEYKRHGISKSEILRCLCCLKPSFTLKEIIRRKGAAKSDGKRCIEAGEKFGLRFNGDSTIFPTFSNSAKKGDY